MSNSDQRDMTPNPPTPTGDPVRDALHLAKFFLTHQHYGPPTETADPIARIDEALRHLDAELARLKDLNEPEEPDDAAFLLDDHDDDLDEEPDEQSLIVDDRTGLVYRLG